MRALLLVPAFLLVGCVSSPQPTVPLPIDYRLVETSQLWADLTDATSTRQIMNIEAELGVRGETSTGAEYLGRRTSASVGVASYLRSGGSTSDRDCSDFPSTADAQRFFLWNGGPALDPHGLDRDGDGYACEFGKTLLASVSRHKSKPVPPVRLSAPRVTSDQCFTGPRGGTYTITASGNKNYGGC
ncbi:excalibur calcium-binding domain-containing protein [Rhizobium leguminosarum]|uniref:excalibur calcium-binding domain-containing protein n=1 Tax=Rhizobium leguminosarum TaxID=384 RepID=UPI00102FFEE3|nr:excalibur calcium-binding domain-containing protein [Rhizobium leguminosarum]